MTRKLENIKENIRFLIHKHNLQADIPEAKEALDKDTIEAYDIFRLEMEGKVIGIPKVCNAIIEKIGWSETMALAKHLDELVKEGEKLEENKG